MTTQERIIKAMGEWMTDEYEERTVPLEVEDNSGVYNLTETNAEYDDNLLFGVNVNVNTPSIIWYVERFGNTIWSNEKIMSSAEELIDFLNSNSFEEITGDEHYEDGGYSKYEGEKVELIKAIALVTPKSISEDIKAELKKEYEADEIIIFGNNTEPLKQLLDALKVEDPHTKNICMQKMMYYVNQNLLLNVKYLVLNAIFCDGATRDELKFIATADISDSPDVIGTITEELEFNPVLESISLF